MQMLGFKLFVSLLFACATLVSNDVILKDFTGKEFKSESNPQRLVITCYGGAVQELAIFAPQKIIAHPGANRFVFFEKLFPNLSKLQSVGTFGDVNLETLLMLKSDMVFAGVTSLAMNERIEKSGVKVFTLGIGRHRVETLLKEFEALGALLGEEPKAYKLIAFWRERLNLIASKLPDENSRRTVLYVNGSNTLSSEGKGWWGDEFIFYAGGKNVVRDTSVQGVLNAENLLALDPELLILSNNKNFQTSKDAILQNPLYKNLSAVKNGRVYAAPVGGFWWDRPSPEAILGIIWLAKILYPLEMREIDLYEHTRLFYKEFYGYELKHEEYATFFASKKEAM